MRVRVRGDEIDRGQRETDRTPYLASWSGEAEPHETHTGVGVLSPAMDTGGLDSQDRDTHRQDLPRAARSIHEYNKPLDTYASDEQDTPVRGTSSRQQNSNHTDTNYLKLVLQRLLGEQLPAYKGNHTDNKDNILIENERVIKHETVSQVTWILLLNRKVKVRFGKWMWELHNGADSRVSDTRPRSRLGSPPSTIRDTGHFT